MCRSPRGVSLHCSLSLCVGGKPVDWGLTSISLILVVCLVILVVFPVCLVFLGWLMRLTGSMV